MLLTGIALNLKTNMETINILTVLSLLSHEHSEVKSLSHVRLFSTPWTVAYSVPPSVGFSRQEYWSGLL